MVAGASVILAGSIGSFLGLFAGYKGGWPDAVIMRATDVQLCMPFLILAMALVAAIGPGTKNIILALGLSSWPPYSRLVRGQALVIRESEYVKAAQAIGASDLWIMLRHVLPNVAPPLIVFSTLQAAAMILSEASLSYLGVGIQPPLVSWGLMVLQARDILNIAWWVAVLPGMAIMFAVLGVNLFGDVLREMLDPRRR
jgi:peptide/nickel transport system permease protein